ncbi:ABC-type multidrug transport system, ATPase and permease component [Belliella baltica DSM 15883]|uniref:ABC-type multidrug transport system, ATPase and permease component n=1 Tax=Belliella baltica (strain DSM 15883 / CIP 108006 / LMG 21964 / BA134) TaxID=866536 RepID=I3Z1R1_BELBD|nr:ABC transporter ATP-binding protein [Belliella baltica]AFL83179.1 ABC-type multidrug transport system, ATPase and permease component [Belliella baltica DSM 15883]
MKPLWRLNKYLLKYKGYLLLGILFTIISNIFVIIPAQLVRIAIDYVVESFTFYQVFSEGELSVEARSAFLKFIFIFGVLILVMALLRGFFLFLIRQTIIIMSRLVEFDMKNEIFDHYQKLPLSFYRRNSTGDLMARITEDVSRVRMYLGPAIMYGLNLVVLFPLVIGYMLSVNVELTIYSLLPLPVLSISIYFVNNLINERSEKIQRSLSGLSTFVQEAFSGIRVLKAFVREDDSANDFRKASEDYKDKSIRLTLVQSLFYPLILALIGISTILTVYMGGMQVIDGTIGYGVIAEFILYVNMLTWPVTSLGWVTSIIQRAAASQQRINEFLDEKNDIISTENLDVLIKGDIRVKNVSFVYPDSGIKALQDVSFSINSGESLAIIGTTGSGKSTIANLLMRMYDVSSGQIDIDGRNIQVYDTASLRKQIGFVPQDVFLFSDSIANNIGFGLDEFKAEQIEKAAKDADVYENIIDFPKGFETKLGERGITLSGGQKQRVSIARAIAKEPSILLLDDCLSAVDTKTENAILNSLKKIMVNRTSIIISHRVSSAKLADKIIVLDDGKLVEQGTHDYLMDKKGVYAELYEKQTQNNEAIEE